MKVLMQVVQATKGFGANQLFNDATFAVNKGEHIGLIGPNGAGKSTLLKVISGEYELDQGKMTTAKNLKIGFLKQEEGPASTSVVEEYVQKNATMPIWNIKSLGTGLGLTEQHFSSNFNELSGGFRMRVKLLHLLAEEPDLLMLDEPTNYLDLESLLVLESFLKNYKGAFILISHDREFLRATTNQILEIESGKFSKYNGSLDDYFEQKKLIKEQEQKAAASVASKQKEILDFAARFGAKATKAKQVQSRLKQLNKLESISLSALPVTAKIRIPEPINVGKQVLCCDKVQLGYETNIVLNDVQFTIQKGQHIGVVGVNGAGKSTLLKALSKNLTPISGKIEWGHNVNVGYFAQHIAESLCPEGTVEQELAAHAHPDVLPQQIKDLAGSLLFSNDDILKKIKLLSGGEKTRVALGQILLKRAPVLLLDEPTNHLDFHTVEALTQALQSYKGTIIVVSHDRSFIRRVSKQILEVRNSKVEMYPGSYEEYVWSLQKGAWSYKDDTEPSSPTGDHLKKEENSSLKNNYKEIKKELTKKVKQLEKNIIKVEAGMKVNEEQIAELQAELINSSGTFAEDLNKKLYIAQSELEKLEQSWFELQERHGRVQEKIDNLVKLPQSD